ncbi:MAG: nucleotidyltransferase family protein [Candidatus Micrarchaeota archaeon]
MVAKAKTMLSPNKIVAILQEHQRELSQFGVKKIGLFGSFLTRKATFKSDLDFLVSFDNPTYDNFMETKFLLEKIFGRKVDLVMETALKPDLRYVKKEALYAKAV